MKTAACLLLLVAASEAVSGQRPHIVIVIADDMGSNDVSFHGSDQYTTPNLDALAYHGVALNRHYSMQSCTPSRAALLTGQYPIRTGFQGIPMSEGEDRYLPDVPTLPELLKKLGYRTHLVGKWHLGAARRENTPTGRGFDSHFGYWGGLTGYFNYVTEQDDVPGNQTFIGFDLKDRFDHAWSYQGKYATDLFAEKATDVLDNHNVTEPLFMVVANLAVHTGTDDKVEVRDEASMNSTLGYIEDLERRRYADALLKMDESVGIIVEKLQAKGMLSDSVILFISDNGAQSSPVKYGNAGSNWPCRGEKLSLNEGGVRNVGIIYSPLLKKKNYVNDELIHITDWLPTLYHLAGGDTKSLQIDGFDQWKSLSENAPTCRKEALLNIDERLKYSGIVGYGGRYKLLNGTFLNGRLDQYSSEPKDRYTPQYDITSILKSKTNKAIERNNEKPLSPRLILSLREPTSAYKNNEKCKNRNEPEICHEFCLFDLNDDPCETENLIHEESKRPIVENLKNRLAEFWQELVPQQNKEVDLNSDPRKYNGTWCTWLDDELCAKTAVR